MELASELTAKGYFSALPNSIVAPKLEKTYKMRSAKRAFFEGVKKKKKR